VDGLKEQFLPDSFDPLGTYPNQARVHAHTRAFIVLSHAEVESFLEDWARDVARASEALWKTKGKVAVPMAYLLCSLGERLDVPTAPSKPATKNLPQRLADASGRLFQRYNKRIKDNHGIMEGNLLALFSPLGLPISACGATLIPNLDSLGRLRGSHAHQSAKAVVSVLDPESEYQRVITVLEDLRTLDSWLAGYKKRIR
jgi:hypothetical protein